MQHVFAQQAKFSCSTINTNKVEINGHAAVLETKLIEQTTKYISRFFKKMSDHIAKDSTPDGIPRFTPVYCKPSVMGQLADAVPKTSTEPKKKKAEDSPPGTPTQTKKTKLKPTGNVDQMKKGMFHAKNGANLNDLFPADLDKMPCAFFCFQGKKCTKPKASCGRLHVMSFNNVEPGDKPKILKHFDTTGNAWLDAKTFQRHKIDVPPEYTHLLGDTFGPSGKKSA